MFYKPSDISREVETKIEDAAAENEGIDYLTFVSDGELTLDIHLGEEIFILKKTKKLVFVITNASPLWREDVRRNLLKANYISLKVDAVSKQLWKRINRPQKDLQLSAVLEGVLNFSEESKGIVVGKTMLIYGVNYYGEIERIGEFLAK